MVDVAMTSFAASCDKFGFIGLARMWSSTSLNYMPAPPLITPPASHKCPLCGGRSCAAHSHDGNHTWATGAQLPDSNSCTRTYRYLWWSIWYEFPIAVGLLASLLGWLGKRPATPCPCSRRVVLQRVSLQLYMLEPTNLVAVFYANMLARVSLMLMGQHELRGPLLAWSASLKGVSEKLRCLRSVFVL